MFRRPTVTPIPPTPPSNAASKHAVEGLTTSAALEVAGSDVRVNAVAPGPTETGMLNRFTAPKERSASSRPCRSAGSASPTRSPTPSCFFAPIGRPLSAAMCAFGRWLEVGGVRCNPKPRHSEVKPWNRMSQPQQSRSKFPRPIIRAQCRSDSRLGRGPGRRRHPRSADLARSRLSRGSIHPAQGCRQGAPRTPPIIALTARTRRSPV